MLGMVSAAISQLFEDMKPENVTANLLGRLLPPRKPGPR
jgi:hypothetical protein